jgi:hypothetical protein
VLACLLQVDTAKAHGVLFEIEYCHAIKGRGTTRRPRFPALTPAHPPVLHLCSPSRFGVLCCAVVWCGVVWCGVVWCGVVWCAVLHVCVCVLCDCVRACADATCRRFFFRNCQEVIRVAKWQNLVLSSSAVSALDVRAPRDVAALLAVVGVPVCSAMDLLSTNCVKVLQHAGDGSWLPVVYGGVLTVARAPCVCRPRRFTLLPPPPPPPPPPLPLATCHFVRLRVRRQRLAAPSMELL